MRIKLCSFGKKMNSTATPPVKILVEKEVKMKNGADLLSPTFEMQCLSDDMTKYNYVYVPVWNRYYYITSVKAITADIVIINCSVDALATYKSDIANSYHVFTRTPYTQANVIEETIPLSKNESVETNSTAMYSDATKIAIYLDVAGKAESGCNPTTTTYCMSVGSLKRLMEKVYEPSTYDASAVMDVVAQTICNPSQYIVGCRIGRFEIHEEAPLSSIPFGWVNITGVEGVYKVQQGMYVMKFDRAITFPSAENDLTKQYVCYIPNIGMFEIKPNDIGNGRITCKFSLDMASGQLYVRVINSSGKIIHIGSGTALVNMPVTGVIAKIPTDISSYISGFGFSVADNITKTVNNNGGFKNTIEKIGDSIVKSWEFLNTNDSKAFMEANPLPSIGSVVDTSLSVAKEAINASVERTVKTVGGSGTLAELFSYSNIEVFTFTHVRLQENNLQGHANYITAKPTDSGYYKVEYSELLTKALPSEKSNIMNHLQSGFFYE